LLAATVGASPANEKPGPKDKAAYDEAYKEGVKRFNEACKTAGKSVRSSIRGVPGIRLEVAPDALSFEQGSIDRNWAFAGMPMERMGDRFIASFLDFNFGDNDLHVDFGSRTGMTVTMTGFQAVDVLQKDATYLRHRLKTKSSSDGMVSEPVARDRAFRHVVSVEPLGTGEDRKHWVGGSLIRVVDGETGQVMGEVRAFSFALPPRGVKAADLDKRTWTDRMSCPKYLDIQSAMTRVSLIGIVDPKSVSVADAAGPDSLRGLEQAVERGLLREATWADVDAWRAAVEASRPRGALPPVAGGPKPKAVRSGEPFRSYVVLKSFVLPSGLYGAHSAQFYVPKGVPGPTGNPGHSTVLDFNTMSCEGPDCGRQ
jgi:hypothetical protein